ncbi:sigma-54-dependent Fis family transcriptional regulator [Tsukamurella sp. USMM236]|uniref:sigma-54-dependent Fis family transcriptional regulator n=1 Tax=Tsukamurella sp. USMM236 TaxID=3081301 RepID=UPI003018AD52
MIDTTPDPVVRPEIGLSWRRSALSGITPERAPQVRIDEDFGGRAALLRAARPILDAAAVQLADTGTALFLVDSDSRIVASTFGGARVARDLDRIGAVRGARMGEDVVGTTALGTPLETRSPLTVNGAEHYLEAYKHLSCFGRPIVHPTTRRLDGILCMTSVGDHVHSLFRPMVDRFAADIESRLLHGSQAGHRLALDAFHTRSGRRGVAVVAVGDDLLLLDNLASDLLDAADIGALRALAADRGGAVPTSLVLSSGVPVEVLATRIAGPGAATVYELLQPDRRSAPIPRGAVSGTTDPLAADLPTLDGPTRTVAVLGEPGTGRTTAARLAAGSAPIELVDAVERIGQGRAPDLAEAAAAARRSGAVLVVDGVDLLPDHELTVLRGMVVRRDPCTILVGPPPSDLRPGASAAVALCDEQIVLPALRHRPGQLAAFASALLDRRGSGGTLGAGVIDALSGHDWPANLSELDRVLAAAVATAATRGSRQVTVEDLPQRYRGTARAAGLTLLERTERQQIIDSLARCRGNKAHAAKELGISRSTLYVRLRALGVDG